jgi:hypothetical protein
MILSPALIKDQEGKFSFPIGENTIILWQFETHFSSP